MTDFTIEFAGLCCYYKVDASLIRVLLVDASAHPRFRHIPHLEVQHNCTVGTPPLPPASVQDKPSYVRGPVLYDAYLLNGVRLWMPSADVDPPDKQPQFDKSVPTLPNVCPEFGQTKIGYFAKDLPPYGTPVAAQFDIQHGMLDLDNRELSKPCFFVPVRNDPPDHPGKARGLATVTKLKLKINGDPLLKVLRFGDSVPKEMNFAPGLTRIRIGNMAEAGILGKDEDDAEHFSIYYAMSDSNCTPLPTGKPATFDNPGPKSDPSSGLEGGCSNSQYP